MELKKSSLPEKNMKRVEDFISRLEVLSYDNEAAMHYGDIRADLGVNDLHVAGHARSRGLIVVTNNTKEFARVEGLRITDWTDGNS